VFQCPEALCSPPLDLLQNVSVLLVLEGGKTGHSIPDAISQVLNRESMKFSWACLTAFLLMQAKVQLEFFAAETQLGCLVLFLSNRTRSFSARLLVAKPQPVLLLGAIPEPMQDFAFAFGELHEVLVSPFFCCGNSSPAFSASPAPRKLVSAKNLLWCL